jgi:hypothetical protein
VGIASNGVQVALNNKKGGFDPMSYWSDQFSYDATWKVDYHPRFIVDVNHDGYPDIVGIAHNGVRTALNNPTGGFNPASLWSDQFGYGTGWKIDYHPRFIA